MACNSCAKPFSFLRKEKGCPNCGFSFCSKCLDNKIFVPKLKAEAKVCAKCKKLPQTIEPTTVEPPDAYYKRLGIMKDGSIDKTDSQSQPVSSHKVDQEIINRLTKLKEDSQKPQTSEEEIAQRLQKIKGDVPKTSDADIQERLARLRGVPVATVQSQTVLPAPDLRTEQEQADDLIKKYMEQTKIDTKYKEEFDGLVNDIESRLGKLKGSTGGPSGQSSKPVEVESDDEDEEATVKKIIEKAKTEIVQEENELSPSTNDELPFCEICNEDAKMRCLGCKYLFCKRCYLEHRDDDDGCNRYEPYSPPKGVHC